MNKKKDQQKKSRSVSQFITDVGEIGELIFERATEATAFAVSHHDKVEIVASFTLPGGERLVPIAGDNSLLKHRVLLLPERPEAYGNTNELVRDIQAYLDRYVDLSPSFRVIAAHYILLTWVYDAFNELPYLRFRGEPGSGKTRALLVVGSLCYQAFLASGASTVSPIFHTLPRSPRCGRSTPSPKTTIHTVSMTSGASTSKGSGSSSRSTPTT